MSSVQAASNSANADEVDPEGGSSINIDEVEQVAGVPLEREAGVVLEQEDKADKGEHTIVPSTDGEKPVPTYRVRKLLLALVCGACFLAAIFGLAYAASELSQDFFLKGAVVTSKALPSAGALRCQRWWTESGFQELMDPESFEGSEECEAVAEMAVSTARAHVEAVLVPSLPDALLDELVALKLVADSAHHLDLARAQALPSTGTRCDSYLELFLVTGEKLILVDTALFLPASFRGKIPAASDAEGPYFQVAEEVRVRGLFNKIHHAHPRPCNPNPSPPALLREDHGQYLFLEGHLERRACSWQWPTPVDDLLQCKDQSFCRGWDCCQERGGRAACPRNYPMMCAEAHCHGDHCCQVNCTAFGGPRPCERRLPRRAYMGGGRSYIIEGGGADEMVLIRDWTGFLRFQRSGESGTRDRVLCSRDPAPCAQQSMEFSIGSSMVSSEGVYSLWRGVLGEEVLQVAVDVATGVPMQLLGRPPFDSVYYEKVQILDEASFLWKLEQEDLLGLRCGDSPLASAGLRSLHREGQLRHQGLRFPVGLSHPSLQGGNLSACPELEYYYQTSKVSLLMLLESPQCQEVVATAVLAHAGDPQISVEATPHFSLRLASQWSSSRAAGHLGSDGWASSGRILLTATEAENSISSSYVATFRETEVPVVASMGAVGQTVYLAGHGSNLQRGMVRMSRGGRGFCVAAVKEYALAAELGSDLNVFRLSWGFLDMAAGMLPMSFKGWEAVARLPATPATRRLEAVETEEQMNDGWHLLPQERPKLLQREVVEMTKRSKAKSKKSKVSGRRLSEAPSTQGRRLMEAALQLHDLQLLEVECSEACRRCSAEDLSCPAPCAAPWCGIQAELESQSAEWQSASSFASRLRQVADRVPRNKTQHLKVAEAFVDAFENLASVESLLHTPSQLAQKSRISIFRDVLNVTSHGKVLDDDRWAIHSTRALDFIRSSLVRLQATKLQRLPVEQLNLPRLPQALTAEDVRQVVARQALASSNPSQAIMDSITNLAWRRSFAQVCFSCSSLQLSLDMINATMSFGSAYRLQLEYVLRGLSLEVTSHGAEGSLEGVHVSAILGLNGQKQPLSIEDGAGLQLRVGSPTTMYGLFGTSIPWQGVANARVETLGWTPVGSGLEITVRYRSAEPYRVSHPLVLASSFLGKVSIGSEEALLVDRLNLTLAFGNATGVLSLNLQSAKAQARLPEVPVVMDGRHCPGVLRALLRKTAVGMGFSERIADSAFATVGSFVFDFHSPATIAYPRVEGVVLPLVWNPELQYHTQGRISGSPTMQYRRVGPSILLDAVSITTLGQPGEAGFGKSATAVSQGDIMLRNFLVPGLVIPLEASGFNVLLASGTTQDRVVVPRPVLGTISRHLAAHFCLNHLNNTFTPASISTEIPLSSNITGQQLRLTLHDVEWQMPRSAAFPLFGVATTKFQQVDFILPAELFFSPQGASYLGGSKLLAQATLQVTNPTLSLPSLQVFGLPLLSRSGSSDGLGRRLEPTSFGGFTGTAAAAVALGAQRDSYEGCPSLTFEADGLPLLGSRLLRRRVGRAIYRAATAKALATDQGTRLAASAAVLHLRLSRLPSLALSLNDGYVTLDDSESQDRLLRRLSSRRLRGEGVDWATAWLEDEGRHLDSLDGEEERGAPVRIGSESEGAEAPLEAAALVALAAARLGGRRLQQGAEVVPVRSVRLAAQLRYWTAGFLNWMDDVVITGLEEREESPIAARVRRLHHRALAAEWRQSAQAAQGRRLASTRILEVPGTTCKSAMCKVVETRQECEALAVSLGLRDATVTPTRKSAGFENPAGCYYNTDDGDFEGLWWNQELESDVGVGPTPRGGLFQPICACEVAHCPLDKPRRRTLDARPDTDFYCDSLSGKAMPRIVGELPMTDVFPEERCKGSACNRLLPLSKAVFEEKCANPRPSNFNMPGRWNSETFRHLSVGVTCWEFSVPDLSPLNVSYGLVPMKLRLLVHKKERGVEAVTSSARMDLDFPFPDGTRAVRLSGRFWYTNQQVHFVTEHHSDAQEAASYLTSFSELFNLTWSLLSSNGVTLKASYRVTDSVSLSGAFISLSQAFPMTLAWPESLEHNGASIFHSIGLQGHAMTEAAPRTREVDGFSFGRQGLPYVCAEVSMLGQHGMALMEAPMNGYDLPNISLLSIKGQLDLKLPSKEWLGASSDLTLRTRLLWDLATGKLELASYSPEVTRFSVEKLSLSMDIAARMDWSGLAENFSLEAVKFQVKGCAFGSYDINTGGRTITLNPYVEGFASGSLLNITSAPFLIEGGVPNVALDEVIPSAQLHVECRKMKGEPRSITITGAAAITLPLSILEDPPLVNLNLNYSNIHGLSAFANLSLQVLPKEWGFEKAYGEFRYDAKKKKDKFVFNLEQNGELKLDSLMPEQEGTILLNLSGAIASDSPFSVNGTAVYTLPESLGFGAREIELVIQVSSDEGLVIQGQVDGLAKQLLDFPDFVEKKVGLGDPHIDGLFLYGKAPWSFKTKTPKVVLIASGSLGVPDAANTTDIDGLLAWSKSGLCAILEFSDSPAVKEMQRLFGGSPQQGKTFSFCEDASVLSDVELPDWTALEKAVKDLQKQQAAAAEAAAQGNRTANRAANRTKNRKVPAKSVADPAKLPETGVGFTLPLNLGPETDVGRILQSMHVTLSEAVVVDFSYNGQKSSGKVKIRIPSLQIGEVEAGENELQHYDFTLEASLAVSTSSAELQFNLSADVELQVDETTLEFLGSVAVVVSTSKVELAGEIQLLQPSVVRMISNRMALVSTSERRVALSVSLSTAGIGFGMAANVLMMAKQDIETSQSPDNAAAMRLWADCNSMPDTCVVVSLKFKILLGWTGVLPQQFALLWEGELSVSNFYQAVSGRDIESAVVEKTMDTWLGSSKFGGFDFNLKERHVQAYAQASLPILGLHLAFNLDLTLGIGDLDLKFELLIASGCLGVTTGSGCIGLRMLPAWGNEDEIDEAAMDGLAETYGNIVAHLALNLGTDVDLEDDPNWGTKWLGDELALEKLSLATSLELSSSSFEFHFHAHSQLSLGFLDHLWPQVDADIDVTSDQLYAKLSIQVVGMRLSTTAHILYKDGFQVKELSLDYDGEEFKKNLRSMVASFSPWFDRMFHILGLYDIFGVRRFHFGFFMKDDWGFKIELEMALDFFGLHPEFSLELDTSWMEAIFNLDFSSIAEIVVHKIGVFLGISGGTLPDDVRFGPEMPLLFSDNFLAADCEGDPENRDVSCSYASLGSSETFANWAERVVSSNGLVEVVYYSEGYMRVEKLGDQFAPGTWLWDSDWWFCFGISGWPDHVKCPGGPYHDNLQLKLQPEAKLQALNEDGSKRWESQLVRGALPQASMLVLQCDCEIVLYGLNRDTLWYGDRKCQESDM